MLHRSAIGSCKVMCTNVTLPCGYLKGVCGSCVGFVVVVFLCLFVFSV